MAEYIDRNDAAQALCHRLNDAKIKGFVVSILMDVPAADVKPVVRGKWLSKEYMYGDPSTGTEDMWVERAAEGSDYCAYCSVCGKYAPYNSEATLILSDFCPNCGADMREADNG